MKASHKEFDFLITSSGLHQIKPNNKHMVDTKFRILFT